MEGRIQEIKDKVTAAKINNRELIEKNVEDILKMIEAASKVGKTYIRLEYSTRDQEAAVSEIAKCFQVIPEFGMLSSMELGFGWTIKW
jgi:hypothetical protein